MLQYVLLLAVSDNKLIIIACDNKHVFLITKKYIVYKYNMNFYKTKVKNIEIRKKVLKKFSLIFFFNWNFLYSKLGL